MSTRIRCIALLIIATGCSQRSPWVVVPTPKAPPTGSAQAKPSVELSAAAPADATAVAHVRSLHFPVPGVDSTRLDDSFDAPRDGGERRHNAIDIMAPRGAPVLSVADGRILRLAKSARGGISMYATDLDEQFVYYYAHLDRYHTNIYPGKPLLRGDTLGYVGTTGNAPRDVPHLHFQVMRMPPDRRYWDGEPINPYPLLRQSSSLPIGR